jgi:glycyl-tRNA synthetase (class II)
VTLRDRDSLEQVRIPIADLVAEISTRLVAPWRSPKADSGS